MMNENKKKYVLHFIVESLCRINDQMKVSKYLKTNANELPKGQVFTNASARSRKSTPPYKCIGVFKQ